MIFGRRFTLLDLNYLTGELLAKLLKARGSRHSGQAKRDPEPRIFEQFWIPAFAGMTE
jgi:hypothetical protein